MDAIEAVLDLAKERDELETTIEEYETSMASLVGKTILMTIGRKKHQRFVECTVNEFHGIDGWEVTSNDDDEMFMITFDDFVSGKVQVVN